MTQGQGFGRKDGRVVPQASAPARRNRLPIVGTIALALIAVAAMAWVFTQRGAPAAADDLLATGEELRVASRGDVPQSAALVRKHPHDPRLRLIHGGHLADAKDFTAAEQEYRTGLADAAALGPRLPAKAEAGLRIALVSDLLRQGRHDEARRTAQPLCSDHTPDAPVAKAVAALHSHGMCDYSMRR